MNHSIPFKVNLNISHTGKHIYQDFQMTFAHEPELKLELMEKLMAFSFYAHADMKIVTEYSKSGLPVIWQKDATDKIIQWIELSASDDKKLRKSLSQSGQVRIFLADNEQSRKWCEKIKVKFPKHNLDVHCYRVQDQDLLLKMAQKSMKLSSYIEDHMILLSDNEDQVEIIVEKIL